ncbi:MAG: nitroreductase family protein, partial [Anaerolineae bacterium]|nr:nitroreductase family protein [Anaerolineae bacterium]
MDFYELVSKRRMVRNFSDEPVDPAAVKRILDAARHGPSAGFTQGQDFIAVTDPAMRKRLADLCGEAEYVGMGFDPFISKPPVLVIPCTNEG